MLLLSDFQFFIFLDIFCRLLNGFSIGLLQHTSYNEDMVHNMVAGEPPNGVLYDMDNHTSIEVFFALKYFCFRSSWQSLICCLTLRITGWQWSAAELPVRVDAVVRR
jgi:hypothetical protein